MENLRFTAKRINNKVRFTTLLNTGKKKTNFVGGKEFLRNLNKDHLLKEDSSLRL